MRKMTYILFPVLLIMAAFKLKPSEKYIRIA